MSRASPTAIRRPPSSCARAIARGQGQVAHARQHLRLAGGEDRQPAPGSGRGNPCAARRRALRDRPRAGARPRRRRARDGAPARARQGVAERTAAPGQADPGHDRGADHRAGRQARDRASAQRGDRRPLARRRARPGRGRRGRALRRPRSFGPQPGECREGPRPTPPQGRGAGALRRHLELSGGSALRTGAIRLQPRSSPRPAADRLRSFVHAGRLPGRRRGVRRQPLGDPSTLAHQVRKLRMRFRLKRIVLVGDRGMITKARIDADLGPAGFDWITALRAPAIKALAAEGGPLQLSLFDERDMAEIASDDYPGERLIVCRNPELAAERTRKRAELIEATEKALIKIRAMTVRKRNPLRGKDKIALKVGAVLDRRHMAKHFELAITDTGLAWSRKAEAIAAEAALDGVYGIRSSLPGDGFPAAAIVLAYKGLSHAERGFRDIKSGDLDVRPIHHRRAHRVRAHVFLCMLAYYVIWHMKRDLAPMLFKDDDPAAAAAQRSSPVGKAKVSPAARRKALRKRTEDGQPVHSFRTLLQDLANLTRNSVLFGDARPTTILARPTPTQTRAFNLLRLNIAA